MVHYLDNSATTKVTQRAAQRALELMTEEYGNPSSLHAMGFRAKMVLDEAREQIAKSLSAKPEEIYFTSGGTESNNLAIMGAARAKKRAGNKIVTTAVEHPSVLEPIKELEKEGFEVVYLKPNSNGNIDKSEIEAVIDEKTILISIMLVNNETGAVLPVKAASDAIKCKKAPALLHVDAVQAFCKMSFSPQKLGADLLTVSGHKIHAPKGVGALYISKKARILPIVFGGNQEKGIRSGTESVPLIGAFAEAVSENGSIAESMDKAKALSDRLISGLAEIDGVEINSPTDALPYIVNFSVGRIKAETMLHFLAQREVYVSSGSACGKQKPSHVLEAMNLPKQRVESAIRASFSTLNTEKDIDALIEGARVGMESLAYA